MADHASALKRQRQSEKRRDRNRAVKSKIKTLQKKVEAAKEKTVAATGLRDVVSALAKAARTGVMHRNTAARKISRLTQRVNKLA